MSLVVANASSGPTTITLSAITASGIVTVKDSGSASGTNTVTIVATAGNTFESGLTSYVLNTASAYMTFVGNASTLKWRVLGSTYADIPVVSPVPSPPALGGNLSATLNNLSVISQAAFYSSVQVQGSLSVFSSITARNINFTDLLTSNGNTFSGAPAGINSAGSVGIGAAAGATTLLVTGTQSNTGTLGVAGAATMSGNVTLGTSATTTLVNSVLQVGNGGGGINWIQDFGGRARVGWGNGAGTDTILIGDPTGSNAGGGVGLYAGGAQRVYVNANGLVTATGNLTVGSNMSLTGVSHEIAANGNTNNDIILGFHHHDNPAVSNERQFISCSPTLNDISIAAGCHSYGANWNPYNTAGTPAVSFVSCRKGLVKIYTGNMTGATADSGLTGTLTSSGGGNWSYSSDERIKENITPLENCLDFVKSVRTVKYSFINANSSVPTQIGFLAQDFQTSFPEVVSENDGGHLGLSYSDTIPIAVAAIKELNTIVESQFSTISTLQSDSLTYSSTISTLQSDSLTYSSTISTLQTDSDIKTSTITALQSALDSQQSTITSILTKIST